MCASRIKNRIDGASYQVLMRGRQREGALACTGYPAARNLKSDISVFGPRYQIQAVA
jgi:hypothetical protein